MPRVTVKPFLGIHTLHAEDDTPGLTFRDLRNAALVRGEVHGRIGGAKVNTTSFGGSGLGVAQFVPRRAVGT